MGTVTGTTHDLFVSYARLDDVPLVDEQPGWVTCLVRTARHLLAGKLGRGEDLDVWMDRRSLDDLRPFAPEIEAAARDSAVLLAVVSPAWLASDWCRREADAFAAAAAARGEVAPCVLLVGKEPFERDALPPALQGRNVVPLWTTDEHGRPRTLGFPVPTKSDADRPYFDKALDIADTLCRELRQRRARSGPGLLPDLPPPAPARAPSAGPAPGPGPCPTTHPAAGAAATVFLAEATDDVDVAREELARSLAQERIRVLPAAPLPRDGDGLRAALARDLAESDLFVQVLGLFPGRRAPDLPEGWVRAQYDAAVTAGCAVLQWRAPETDPAAVRDSDHRALLDGPHVAAVGLARFLRLAHEKVLAAAERRAREAARAGGETDADPFVFVNADDEDQPLAEAVVRWLAERNVTCATRPRDTSIRAFSAQLEECLRECDALLVVQGRTADLWVLHQLRKWRRLRALGAAEGGARTLGVLRTPPASAGPFTCHVRDLRVIEVREPFDPACLDSFLAPLLESSGPDAAEARR